MPRRTVPEMYHLKSVFHRNIACSMYKEVHRRIRGIWKRVWFSNPVQAAPRL